VPFAAAHSVHPSAVDAIGEITGQVVDRLDDEAPDLALLFVTGHHTNALAECGTVVRTLLRPGTLVGGTFAAVLANGQQSDRAAMTLWAGRFGEVQPISYGREGQVAVPSFEPSALVVLVDPYGFPIATALAALAKRWPGLPIIGAMASSGASSGRSAGGNRLLLDDRTLDAGAVGVLLGPGVEVVSVLSQGSRPVGPSYVVTAGGDGVIRELDGAPAASRLRELTEDALSEDEIAVVHAGNIHVGRTLSGGGVLVRPITRIDRLAGALAVADVVEIGATVSFHLRTADAADDDLRAALNGRSADSALVFPHVDRGATLLETPGLDASVVDEYLGRIPTAGASGAGILGPVGADAFVHQAGVSMALLRQRERPVWSGS